MQLLLSSQIFLALWGPPSPPGGRDLRSDTTDDRHDRCKYIYRFLVVEIRILGLFIFYWTSGREDLISDNICVTILSH